MATSKLQTSDVLKLLAACKENGVTNFKFGDLTVTFEKADQPSPNSQVPTATIPENIPQNTQDSISNQADQKLDEEKERLAMLLIEDPLELETQIARGDLVDEATEH